MTNHDRTSAHPVGRRRFLASSIGAVAAGVVESSKTLSTVSSTTRGHQVVEAVPAMDLVEASIDELGLAMAEGRESAESLVDKYVQRIQAIDRSGPTLGSVLEINPDAREIAARLDAQRRAGRTRGPLHGIPILLKDNIATADKMKTTAGSIALLDASVPNDSFVVSQLRRAGAVLLGKTNLSEWANFRSTRSSSGWSGRGGQCHNPYVLSRNPCGSSSGSGAATAASLASVSLGTETDGSIVCPSNANGLVGFKPTLGLVSRSGIIPIAHSQDTAGPMTRTVADAAHVMTAILGADDNDPGSTASRISPDAFADSLDAGGLRGVRIGVARRFFGFHSDVDRTLEVAIEALGSAGAILVDPVDYPEQESLNDAEFKVLLYEFKTDLNRYLSGLSGEAPRTLAELIRFNVEHHEREMPYFGQEIFEQAVSLGGLDSDEYRQALATCRRLSRDEGIDAVMAKYSLNAIVAPTGGPAWVTDLINGDHFSGGSSQPAAVAGYPNITVPAGWVHELPVGLSFFGRAFSDADLLRYAYAFEQESMARRAPKYLTHIGAVPD